MGNEDKEGEGDLNPTEDQECEIDALGADSARWVLHGKQEDQIESKCNEKRKIPKDRPSLDYLLTNSRLKGGLELLSAK